MRKFWFLLGVAFFDLVVAAVLIGRGATSAGFIFFVLAALVGGYALFSPPKPQRDARGRLQPVEAPFGALIGVVGAIAILGGAAYVAFATGTPKPATPKPPRPAAVAPVASSNQAESWRAPPPRRREWGGVIYKCIAANGHPSYQSQPCPPGSERAWVRDATPDPPPSRAELERQARARRAEQQQAQQNNGTVYWTAPSESGSAKTRACKAARAADAEYRRQPLSQITHDGLRWHGDQIQEACY